jgi:hypothetical protein
MEGRGKEGGTAQCRCVQGAQGKGWGLLQACQGMHNCHL